MPESHDPLRSLFQEAASTGRSRAHCAPVSAVTERGDRVRRHRMAALAAAACLVFAGGTAAAVTLLPDRPHPSVPATPGPSKPSPTPPRTGTPRPTSTAESSAVPTSRSSRGTSDGTSDAPTQPPTTQLSSTRLP